MSKIKQNKIEETATFINPDAEKERLLEERRIKDNKIVKGVFRFHEVPGGSVTFPFRKYKKDGIKTYTLEDGKTYEIPLCVAKHLNQSCSYPVHAHAKDANGLNVMNVGKTVHRTSFHSLDFIDTSDSDSIATMGPTQIEIV